MWLNRDVLRPGRQDVAIRGYTGHHLRSIFSEEICTGGNDGSLCSDGKEG
jgi:hypothetical protein